MQLPEKLSPSELIKIPLVPYFSDCHTASSSWPAFPKS
jgi:hypothetical protein